MFNLFKTNEKSFENYEFARYGLNLIDLDNYRKNNLLLSHNFKHSDYILFSQRYKIIDIKDLQKIINLAKINEKKLIVFLKRPEFGTNNKKNQTKLDLFYLKNDKKVVKELMDNYLFDQLKTENFILINREIRKMYKKQVMLFDIYPIFCNNNINSCQSIDDNGKKIFYDYGHLTLDGSKYIGNILFETKFHENYLN